MPQLDKYIYFTQIGTLLFFFFILYLYVRGVIIPKFNKLLKYRYKKLSELVTYDKGNRAVIRMSSQQFGFFGFLHLQKINNFYPRLSNFFYNYKKNSLKQLSLFHFIYKQRALSKIIKEKMIFNFFYNYNLFEKNRINTYLSV